MTSEELKAYESQIAAPGQKNAKPKYQVRQMAQERTPAIENMALLGNVGKTFGDYLFNTRGQKDPKEFRNAELQSANMRSEQGFDAGKQMSSQIMGQASSIANKLGDKAFANMAASSANTGYEGGNAAAALADVANDQTYSNASMQAYGQGAETMKNTYDTKVGQDHTGSQLVQNLDPGLDKDIAGLDAFQQMPENVVDSQRRGLEYNQTKDYDRYLENAGAIKTDADTAREALAKTAVPGDPSKPPFMNLGSSPATQPAQPANIENAMYATNTMDMLGIKKPNMPLDLNRPKTQTKPPIGTLNMLGGKNTLSMLGR